MVKDWHCIIVNFFVVGTVFQFAIKNQVTLVTCILLQIFSNCVFWFYKGSKISKYIFFLVASSNKKNQWKQKLSSFSVVVFEFWRTRLKRSIFQTLWKPDFGARFLFIELDTSNFGYLLIFWFCWTVQSLRKIGQHLHYTFYKGPHFDIFLFL